MLLFWLEGGGRTTTTRLHDNSCISNSSGLINYVMSSKRANKRTVVTKATAAAAAKKASHNQQQIRLKELTKGQSDDELKSEDDPFHFSHLLSEHHDESSAASSSRADEDFRGSELSEKEILDLAFGHDEREVFSADSDDIGRIIDLHADALTSNHFISEDGLLGPEDLHSPYDDVFDSPEVPSAFNESSQDEFPPPSSPVASPGKTLSKKGRSEKKSGNKKSPDRVVVDEVSSEASQSSSDVGLKADTSSAEIHIHGRDSIDVAHDRIAENHAVRGLGKSPDDSSSGDAVRRSESRSEGFTKEDIYQSERGGLSMTALRSPGRWADVSEEAEPAAGASAATSNVFTEQGSNKGKLEQQPTVEGSSRVDSVAGALNSYVKRHEVDGSQNDHGLERGGVSRASGKDIHKEYETGSKGQRTFERADSWNNRKEQDLRSKAALGPSQASRESNWRRRPMEARVGQEFPKGNNKSGFDADSVKDDQQDFRSRAQHGAEPQATHKNWIPRRGIQREGDQKARGKGKQGREGAPQTESVKDVAHQKLFEAGLRIEKEKLFQRSKEFLKAEVQKTKQMEQARRGRDELEMELNKNLVLEEGELFYVNS